MTCSHDPRELAGQPIGMYHCPECGEMVVAGMPHQPVHAPPPVRMDLEGCDGESGRCRAALAPAIGGDFVLYSDYEALLQERLDLQIENEGLQKHIGTLERRLEALHERFNLSPSSGESR